MKLFRQGELNRLILDGLRTASGPMWTRDVARATIIMLGHEETARTALVPRVRANLQNLMNKQGTATKIGSGRDAKWALT